MNKNLPNTVQTIRALLDSQGDVATTIAHALDGQGLLVDPERTYGAVLRRTPKGWAPVTPPAPGATFPDMVTVAQADKQQADASLQEQARAWDRVCQRTRDLAAAMATQYAAEPDVTGVTADRDTVIVSLHITDPARWAAWMTALGLTDSQITHLDYAVIGRTSWDGVPLSVLAYDVPELQAAAMVLAARPYLHDGVVYDLALPQKDAEGDTWYYQAESADGMPFLSIDGRPERCTLANIVELVGPLNAVRDLLTVAPGGAA